MEPPSPRCPAFVTDCPNLASPRLGATVIYATDDFFAPKERLIDDRAPVFVPGKYDEHGKWMDGWESRRKRVAGHDFCIVRLGAPGIVRGVDIDTSHFTGNYPPEASIEAALCEGTPEDDGQWREIVERQRLAGDCHHYVAVEDEGICNHLRLHIYPDGGVARLRVHGDPVPAWRTGEAGVMHELSAMTNGGRIVAYNDAHYGEVWTLLTAGRGIDMGDGWETRRRREPGNDWILVELGAPGTVEAVEIDTAHFKGNYPDRASLQAAMARSADKDGLIGESENWPVVLGRKKLEADRIHRFGSDEISGGDAPVSHVRLNIFPDGGISRLRIFGKPAR